MCRDIDNGNLKGNRHTFTCNVIDGMIGEIFVFWPFGETELKRADFECMKLSVHVVKFRGVCPSYLWSPNDKSHTVIGTEYTCNINRLSACNSATDIQCAECFQ